MRLNRSLFKPMLATALAVALLPAALAQPKERQGVLVNERGHTLYIFDNDKTTPGKSACTGACLNMWTPFYAKPGAKPSGEDTLLTRDDGKLQWVHKGRPLYTWYTDEKPGDKGGDGLRGVWHMAMP